jgi:general stress protein YciG
LSHREISALGGASLKKEQRTYFKNRELAREAGRKGGLASAAARRLKSADGPT